MTHLYTVTTITHEKSDGPPVCHRVVSMSRARWKLQCGITAMEKRLQHAVDITNQQLKNQGIFYDTKPTFAVYGDDLLETLKIRARHFPTWYKVYGSLPHRQMKLESHRRTQIQLHLALRDLVPKDGLCVIGDWTGRGPRGNFGSWLKIRRYLLKHRPGQVALHDEFRTSKLCCRCHHILQPAMFHEVRRKQTNGCPGRFLHNPDGTRRVTGSYGVKHCYKCNIRFNRDINGAINIYMGYKTRVLTGFVPAPFRRSCTKEHLAATYTYQRTTVPRVPRTQRERALLHVRRDGQFDF